MLDHTEGEDSEAIKANRDCETKALEEKIHDIEDPHISLSRTFVLRYHQIQPFVADLRRQLSTFPRYVLDSEKKPVSKEPVQIKPVQIEPVQSWQYANRQKLTRGFRFEVSLEGVELFENDENTRIFGRYEYKIKHVDGVVISYCSFWLNLYDLYKFEFVYLLRL